MATRTTSSMYSDQFELDDLLCRLSEQVTNQGERAIQGLKQENRALGPEQDYFRRSWAAIYEMLTGVNDILNQLTITLAEMNEKIESEQNTYRTNCTAI